MEKAERHSCHVPATHLHFKPIHNLIMASTFQSLLRSTSPIQWMESELDNIASQIPIIQKVWKDKPKELEYQFSQQAMGHTSQPLNPNSMTISMVASTDLIC